MKLSSQPENYCGLFADPVFVFDECDPGQSVLIDIYAGDPRRLLCSKRFKGQETVSVNPSSSLISVADPLPFYASKTDFFDDPYGYVKTSIACGDVSSDTVIILPGRHTEGIYGIYGGGFREKLFRDETEQLCIICGDGSLKAEMTLTGSSTFVTETEWFTPAEGVAVFILHLPGLLALSGEADISVFNEVAIRIWAGESLMLDKTYRIAEPHPSTKLYWLNDRGGVDSFTFDHHESTGMDINRQIVDTSAGFRTGGSSTIVSHTVSTGYISRETASQLSGIFLSPKVWLMDGTSFREVCLVDDYYGRFDGIPEYISVRYMDNRTDITGL